MLKRLSEMFTYHWLGVLGYLAKVSAPHDISKTFVAYCEAVRTVYIQECAARRLNRELQLAIPPTYENVLIRIAPKYYQRTRHPQPGYDNDFSI